MRAAKILSIGFVCAILVQPVSADEVKETPYSPEDVIANMLAQADMGAARALCIGTKSECAESAPKVSGFDMLLEFGHNSSELVGDAKSNLEIVASALSDERLRNAKFSVNGYTDAFGTDAYNDELSLSRAKAVSDFLVARNIDPARIDAKGFGELSPRSDNPYDPKNRFVELRLIAE